MLAFALALTLLTGVLFGLVPALQTARVEVVGALKNQAAPPRRLAGRSALVVGQIALSLLLLVLVFLINWALTSIQQRRAG